eukprot:TRINITY_DN806_c0_g1_i1.p1 TRINITY_DN806_c0_g1~~TRINITY_DN806_c0_g1_i1.p1  ORF type:complete len:503 (+),score=81.06 TRINITY_DN806_c0_g1_i1:49-1557(+)
MKRGACRILAPFAARQLVGSRRAVITGTRGVHALCHDELPPPFHPIASKYIPPALEEAVEYTGEIEAGTTPTGIKVFAVDTPYPQANVSLFVKNAGTRTENADTLGYSHLFKHLAFTRTDFRSPVRVVREMQMATERYESSVDREYHCYSADTYSENHSDALSIIFDTMRPLLREYVITDSAGFMKADSIRAESDAKTVVWEALHRVAYRGTGLGNPLFCPSNFVDTVADRSVYKFEEFILDRFELDNFVLVGTGVDAEELTDTALFLTEELREYSPLPPAGYVAPEPLKFSNARFTGGEYFEYSTRHDAIGLAFEGVAQSSKDAHVLEIITNILGGGSQASLLGPGRNGASTILSAGLIKDNGAVREVSAFNQNYADSGIFGVYAEAKRGTATEAIQGIVAGLRKLSSVGAEEVKRAVTKVQVNTQSVVDSPAAYSQFIGKQAIAGKPQSLKEYTASLGKVTAADVKRVAKKILSSDPVVVVSGGLTDNLPVSSEIKANLS